VRDHARVANPEDIQRLKTLLTRGGAASLMWRGRIVLAFLEGATYEELRDRFGGSPTSHSRWIHRFREHGLDGLRTRKRGPRKAPVRESLLRWLPPVLAQGPADHGLAGEHWTLEALQQLREQQTGEHVSLESIRLALHRLGAPKRTASPARRTQATRASRTPATRSWWRSTPPEQERTA
jgi:transposase